MRILFISTWFPYPPSNGSKIRAFQLLRQLAASHEISLVTFADPGDAACAPEELRNVCESIRVVPRRSFRPDSMRSRIAFFRGTPRWLVDSRSPQMEQAIREAMTERLPDAIVAFQLPAAIHATGLGTVPAVAEEVELGVLHDQYRRAPDAARRIRFGLTWRKHQRFLRRLLGHFDACTVVSERERELLEGAGVSSSKIHVVPNSVPLADDDGVVAKRDPNLLVFAGALSYFANRNGIEWFIASVLPRIVERRSDVRLVVTGDPAGVRLGGGGAVEQLGHVADVRPIVGTAAVSISPILEGGGTRVKILEAMALGTPVVSTRKGAEGLDVVDGEHLLLADSPGDFAEQVARLLEQRQLAATVAENGRRLVRERYDARVVCPRFEQLLVAVARRRLRG
jgi:glycosyltransferase involved in cell wall biosynthesis